jgi:probable F420-dependent oxidoreductase
MKFIIKTPTDQVYPEGAFQTAAAVREVSQAIERSRASGACLTDHPAPPSDWLHGDMAAHDALDPFAGLAFIGAATTTLMLVTEVVVLPYRNPFITAKAAATLQVLSDNRLILGVGVGYQQPEFEAVGVPFNQRGALTDEALETIRLAWAGGAVVKKGRNFNAIGNEPRPVPNPAPPIWIGGSSDKALERAVKWGDGWAPFFSIGQDDQEESAGAIGSIATLAKKVTRLKEMRVAQGKTGAYDISITSPYFPEANTREAAEKMRGILQELTDAGVTWFTMILRSPSRAEFLENLAWFDEEVMAHFTP